MKIEYGTICRKNENRTHVLSHEIERTSMAYRGKFVIKWLRRRLTMFVTSMAMQMVQPIALQRLRDHIFRALFKTYN